MQKTKGFSLIELLIVVAIILIIAAIAIPNLLRSRMAAHEASAAATLRNINNSQAAYIAEFGGAVGYADSMAKLGPAPICDVTHACLVDNVLGCAAEPCLKSGYGYFLTAASPGEFVATATPIIMGSTGGINYCTADDGVIRQEIIPTVTLAAALTHAQCLDVGTYTPLSK